MSRSKIASLIAEFLGTMFLSMAALSLSSVNMSYFGAVTVAGALFTAIMVLGRYSGGHFNPAVSLAMCMSRSIDVARAIAYIAAQFLGALCALLLFSWWVGGVAKVTVGEFDGRLLSSEALGAGILVLGVVSAVQQRFLTFKAAATISSSLFIGLMIASIAGVAVLNPAVALATRNFELHYLIGPLLGAGAAQIVYSTFLSTEVTRARVETAASHDDTATMTATRSTVTKVTTKKKR